MEPVIFNPNSNEDKDKSENETKDPVSINVTDGNQENPSTADTVTDPDETPTSERQASPKSDTLPSEGIEADHHKEILPSMAIPAESMGIKSAKKKKIFAGLAIIVVVAVAAFGAFQVFANKQNKTITADQSPKEIAELRIGSNQYPFNTYYPDPNYVGGASYSVNLQVYEGLVGFKDANSFVPLLAESWTNPDDLTWVFQLKPNVTFHNGKPLTAEDVKRSLDEAVSGGFVPSLFIDTIESVAVQDAQRVVIKTKVPDAILINKLPLVYITSSEKVNGIAAGTGAYRPDSSTPTDKEMKLVAFDDYHGGRPAVRTITWLGFDSEPEVLQAVKDNKLDITDLLVKVGTKPEDVSGFNKVPYSVGDISYVGINARDTKSPLSKLKVRQALASSLDSRDFLTKNDRLGNVPSQMTVLANFGYNPDLKKPVRDVAKAKALLKEAGYPNGLKLKLAISDNEANRQLLIPIITQAAEAGITIELEGFKTSGEFFTAIDGGKTQLHYLSVTSVLVDSYDLFAYNFRSKNFDNTTLNKLLDDSTKEFDTAKRKLLLQEASKLIVDEAAAVPLAENTNVYYIRDSVSLKIDPAGYAIAGYIRTASAK